MGAHAPGNAGRSPPAEVMERGRIYESNNQIYVRHRPQAAPWDVRTWGPIARITRDDRTMVRQVALSEADLR